jgi:hypothetical protein
MGEERKRKKERQKDALESVVICMGSWCLWSQLGSYRGMAVWQLVYSWLRERLDIYT